jgi:hypothetical protein
MGSLFEDMSRLAGEIRALHGSRRTFRKELADGSRDRKMDVFEMRAGFAEAQARVAEGGREQRFAFLKNLRRTVGGQQRGMRADLAAARRVWGESA